MVKYNKGRLNREKAREFVGADTEHGVVFKGEAFTAVKKKKAKTKNDQTWKEAEGRNDKPVERKARVGVPSKPFLGSKTTKLKKWPQDQKRLFEYMSDDDYEDTHWQHSAIIFGIMYRFWFLHATQYYVNDEQRALAMRRIFREIKDMGLPAVTTLINVKQKCYELRGSMERMGRLVREIGPAIAPRARIQMFSHHDSRGKAVFHEDYVHRIPINEVLNKMKAIERRRLQKLQAVPHAHADINGMQGTVKGNAYVESDRDEPEYGNVGVHKVHLSMEDLCYQAEIDEKLDLNLDDHFYDFDYEQPVCEWLSKMTMEGPVYCCMTRFVLTENHRGSNPLGPRRGRRITFKFTAAVKTRNKRRAMLIPLIIGYLAIVEKLWECPNPSIKKKTHDGEIVIELSNEGRERLSEHEHRFDQLNGTHGEVTVDDDVEDFPWFDTSRVRLQCCSEESMQEKADELLCRAEQALSNLFAGCFSRCRRGDRDDEEVESCYSMAVDNVKIVKRKVESVVCPLRGAGDGERLLKKKKAKRKKKNKAKCDERPEPEDVNRDGNDDDLPLLDLDDESEDEEFFPTEYAERAIFDEIKKVDIFLRDNYYNPVNCEKNVVLDFFRERLLLGEMYPHILGVRYLNFVSYLKTQQVGFAVSMYETEAAGLRSAWSAAALKERRLYIHGAGGNFFAKGLFSKGSGSKSKQAKNIEADPEGVEHAQSVDSKLSADDSSISDDPDEVKAALRNGFLYAKRPSMRTIHSDPNDVDEEFDQCGSPFCGLVAIDVASNSRVDVDKYLEMLPDNHAHEAWVILGDDQVVKEYCWHRGHNLRILLPPGGPPYMDFENAYSTWIVLRYLQPNGEGPGHYIVMCKKAATMSRYALDEVPGPVCTIWLDGSFAELTKEDRLRRVAATFSTTYDMIEVGSASFTLSSLVTVGVLGSLPGSSTILPLSLLGSLAYVTYRAGKILSRYVLIRETPVLVSISCPPSDDDVRTISNRRDEIEYHDQILTVDIKREFFFDALEKEIPLFDAGVTRVQVSSTLYRNTLAEMEATAANGMDPLKALASISRHRSVNVQAGCNIVNGTACLLRIAGLRLTAHKNVGNNVRGLIALAAPAAAAAIPNVGVAITNQTEAEKLKKKKNRKKSKKLGLKGAGMPNHVLSYNLVQNNDSKLPEVGIYPLGPLYTDDGPVGPGFFATTNSCNTLASFVGRGMTKDLSKRNSRLIGEFIDYSKGFLDYYIDSCDIRNVWTGDPIEFFADHYKGKRSFGWITNKVDNYKRYLSGQMSAGEEREYNEKGFFVKFEANIKDGRPRPRGIMTMSERMLIECCPIISVIEVWNHSFFEEFQVKGLNPADTMRQMLEHTDCSYSVSDYSSFESSIDVLLRQLEEYVIYHIACKADAKHLWDAYHKHASGMRTLTTKWGDFSIGTRCSGDFWTSFGNGLLNVCVMRFCAYKKETPFVRMLAEGDDGLVPSTVPDPELINSLGLSFSQVVTGTQDGDCDFLRKRVVGMNSYLSVGKVLCSLLLVKKGHSMKPCRYKSIMRCMAHSVYHTAPGHPVIQALVNRIWKETHGLIPSKNIMEHFRDKHHAVNISDPGLKFFPVNEDMRACVAEGATGFFPIPIAIQLELERRFMEEDHFYIGSMLEGDEDLANCQKGTILRTSKKLTVGEIFRFVDECPVVNMTEQDRCGLVREVTLFQTFK